MKYSGITKKHSFTFAYAGEIRFGPPYFNLEIDGIEISGRLFSDKPVWSEDENIMAIQEWNSTKESEGPNMKLCIFDLENKREYIGKPVHGYTKPKKFEDNILIYEKTDWSTGVEVSKTVELDLTKIESWENT